MVVNLTPHAILVKVGNSLLTFPPSGQLARVDTSETVAERSHPGVLGVPLVRRELGTVQVPGEYAPDDLLIVSAMVLDAAKNQGHSLVGQMAAPDTGPTAIREKGQVVGVTRLIVAYTLTIRIFRPPDRCGMSECTSNHQ